MSTRHVTECQLLSNEVAKVVHLRGLPTNVHIVFRVFLDSFMKLIAGIPNDNC